MKISKNTSRLLAMVLAVLTVVSLLPSASIAVSVPSVVAQTEEAHDTLSYRGENPPGVGEDPFAELEKYAEYIELDSGNAKFDLTLKVTGNTLPVDLPPVPPPTITLFVLDASGSMDDKIDGVKKIDSAKKSIKDFVDTVVPADEVAGNVKNFFGLVTFYDDARIVSEFTKNVDTFKSSVTNASLGRFTNIQGGLITAYRMLEKPEDFFAEYTSATLPFDPADALVNLIFLGDGEANRSFYYYTKPSNGGWSDWQDFSSAGRMVFAEPIDNLRPGVETQIPNYTPATKVWLQTSENYAFTRAQTIAALINEKDNGVRTNLPVLDNVYSVYFGSNPPTNAYTLLRSHIADSLDHYITAADAIELAAFYKSIGDIVTVYENSIGAGSVIQDTVVSNLDILSAEATVNGTAVTSDHIFTLESDGWDDHSGATPKLYDYILINGQVVKLVLASGLKAGETAELVIHTRAKSTAEGTFDTNVSGASSSLIYNNRTTYGVNTFTAPFAVPVVNIPTKEANLTIEKCMVGSGDLTKVFDFTVNAGGSAFVGSYTLIDTDSSSSTESTPDGVIGLKAGQKAVIKLPVGASYTITEADYVADGYEAYVGDTKTNTSSGSVVAGGVNIIFKNKFIPKANVKVTKSITNNSGVSVPAGTKFNFAFYSAANADSIIGSIPAFAITTPASEQTVSIPVNKLSFGDSDSVTVYVHETSVDNADFWIADTGYYPVTIGRDGSVLYGASATSATVTNTYKPLADLTVEKSISGAAPSGKTFNFDVSFSGLTGNVDYRIGSGELQTVAAGSIPTIALGHDSSVTFYDLPVGQAYTITESGYDSYVSSLGATGSTTGTIASGGSTVNVTNTRQSNSITVSKIVVGGPAEASFGVASNAPSDSEAASFSIAPGAGKSFTLPVGETYTFTETADGEYTTEVSVDGGAYTAGNAGSVRLTATGNHSVVFRNTYKVGSLAINKKVMADDGASPALSYTVKVELDGDGYFDGISFSSVLPNVTEPQTKAYVKEGNVYTFLISDLETVTINNIPQTTDYSVYEVVPADAEFTSSAISDDPAEGTIGTQASSVNIINTYTTPTSGLTIAKAVLDSIDSPDGANGPFAFELRLWREEAREIPVFGQDDAGAPIQTGTETETVEVPVELDDTTLDNLGLTKVMEEDVVIPGLYSFTITPDSATNTGSKIFEGFPEGTFFRVTETDNKSAKSTDLVAVNADKVNSTTATGKIVWDASGEKSIRVTYANSFLVDSGTLTIHKSVIDPATIEDSNKLYGFEIQFTGNIAGITPDGPVFNDEGEGRFTFSLKAGETIYFYGMHNGTGYTLTETDSGKADDVDIDNASDSFEFSESDPYSIESKAVEVVNSYNTPVTTTEKTADRQALRIGADAVITYTVVVKNTSQEEGVTLTEIVDNMLANDEELRLYGPDGALIETGYLVSDEGVMTIDPGIVLMVNETAKIEYKVTVAADSLGESVSNEVNTLSLYNEYEVRSDDSLDIPVIGNGGVTIDKTVAKSENGVFAKSYTDFKYKDDAVYKVVIKNTGSTVFDKVTLNDVIFADIASSVGTEDSEIISVTNSANEPVGFFFTENNVMVFGSNGDQIPDYYSLGIGEEITVLYKYPVTAYGVDENEEPITFTNTATVKAYDPAGSEDGSSSAETAAETPEIEVEKSADVLSAKTGETISYHISITNTYDEVLALDSLIDNMLIADGDGYALSGDVRAYKGEGELEVDLDDAIGKITFSEIGQSGQFETFAIVQDEPDTTVYLAPNEVVVVTYTIFFSKAGTYTNTAEALATFRGLPAGGESSEDVTVTITDPGFNAIKSVSIDGGSTYAKEKTITLSPSSYRVVRYKVVISNDWDYPVGSLTFTDDMLDNTGSSIVSIYSSSDAAGSSDRVDLVSGSDYGVEGSTIFFEAELGSNKFITVIYDARVYEGITNTANIEGVVAGDGIEVSVEATSDAHVNVNRPNNDDDDDDDDDDDEPPVIPPVNPPEEEIIVLGEKEEEPPQGGVEILGEKEIPAAGGITMNMIMIGLGLLLAALGIVANLFIKKRLAKNN